jgi:hypothetical protein
MLPRMGCRGVLFAIPPETAEALLAADDDEALMELVDELEEAWEEPFVGETDKAWDAIHRALSDGTLDPEGGEAPLRLTILGGEHLYEGDDYIVALVSAAEVPAVAEALAAIDLDAFRERYARLVPHDYAPEHGDEDREYSAEYFREVATLYQRAAKAGRAVVFTVDQ